MNGPSSAWRDIKIDRLRDGLYKRNGQIVSREEISPAGMEGLAFVGASAPFSTRAPDIDDLLVVRPRQFRLVIWEPLLTKAPAPPKAAAFCCYSHTVIFYVSPYIVRPWRRIYAGHDGRLQHCSPSFEQWDQIETRLMCDDVVEFEGEYFVTSGGRVVWAKRRWWMCRGARRQQNSRGAS